MAQYIVTDSELGAVADEIRRKGGTSADLEWTAGYIAAIRAISGGGASGYFWRVRYYSQDGAVLIHTEYVEDGGNCGYAFAGEGWSTTAGGSAVSGVTRNVSGNLDLYFTEAYIPLEYIEATGTQWINTGVPGNTAGLHVELAVQPTAINDQGYFGNAWATNGFFLMIYQGKWRFHSGGSVVDDGAISVSADYSLVLENTSLTVNETVYSLAGGSNQSGNLSLLYNFGSGFGTMAKAKLKAAKIYGGGVLLRDYVPALDGSSIACLYDKVSRQYTYNSGTGTFVTP